MGTLNQNTLHYTKFSVYKWRGAHPRYKVNQSIRTTTNDKMLHFTWHFTRELREMWNSVNGAEDEHWYGFKEAERMWRKCRKIYGNDVVLWVAKANHRKQWKRGQVQPNVRVPRTVAVMLWNKTDDTLMQWVWMDDWHQDFEFYTNKGEYNMKIDYRNPMTTVSGGTAPGGW